MKSASFRRGFGFGSGDEGVAGGPRPGERRTRLRGLRKARLRSRVLESLEPRTLMAVLPPPALGRLPNGAAFQLDLSNPTETVTSLRFNESNPNIAVSPNDSNKMVAVWQEGVQIPDVDTPINSRMAYSLDGGKTWTSFNLPQPVFDPSLPGSNQRVNRVTDPTVSFDRNDNLFVVASHQSAQNLSGAIVMQKYNFRGGVPVQTIQNKIIYAWNGDAAINPVVAVDNTLPTFTDPNTFQTLNNPFVGYVYIAWGTDDLAGGNPNTIKLVASSDGGQTFTTRRTINDEQGAGGQFFQPTAPGVFPANVSGNSGAQRNTHPRIVISQGTLDGSVQPGQVNILWDDFGSGPVVTGQPVDLIRADRVSGAVAGQSFTAAGTIGSPNPGLNEAERITNFPVNVNINAAGFQTVRDINFRVAIENPTGADLEVTLVAPDGRTLPLVPSGTFANYLGIGAGNQVFGTVFDEESITPIGAGVEPFVGHFLPNYFPPTATENFNLSDYYNLAPGGVAGTWYVRVRNTSPLADIDSPPILRSGTLEFSSGLVPGVDRIVTTTLVRGALTTDVPASGDKLGFPLFDADAPVQFDRGIGPGATLASDNTISALMENSGRLYVAYVDYIRTAGGAQLATLIDNTNIFLRWSDDGGITWSAPRMVNDDVDSTRDGFSESVITSTATIGRPQFMPSLAVDQTTGALAVSFYDARWDAARTRVGMTVTTSIDGGLSFSPQGASFANQANAPFDEITRNPVGVNLGPIPDNLSAGNPDAITFTREGAPGYGFGDRQALLFHEGKIYVGWSSNANGGTRGLNLLDIRLTRMDTAAGPRIISSTMGGVKATTVDGVTFNASTDPNGTPRVEGFVVTFDRPVDVRTFVPGDVTAFFRAPTFVPSTSSPYGEPVGVASVTPLDPSGFGNLRATTFLVRFSGSSAQLSRVGTYSYAVGPDIRDFGGNFITAQIPNPTPITGTTTNTPLYTTLELPIAIPAFGTVEPKLNVSGLRADELLANLDATLSISHAQTSALTISLIGPDGTEVLLADGRGSGADFIDTTFTDAAPDFIGDFDNTFTGSFRPEEPLANLTGKPINGEYRLKIVNNSNVVGSVDFFTLTLRHGPVVGNAPISSPESGRTIASLDVTGFTGAETIKEITVHTSITHARPSDLTMFLIHPDGTRVALPDLSSNTITAPLAGKGINGAYRLEVNDLVGGEAGVIDDFRLDITSQQQTAFPAVSIPATGVANARVTIAGFSPGQEISNITVNLSIQHNRSRDLQLRLIAPDGTTVLLAQNRGGNTPNAYNNTTFDDAAAMSISTAPLPFANTSFQPEVPPTAPAGNDLANLIGKSPNGQWTLQIQDTVAGTGGNLTGASILFETKASAGNNGPLGIPDIPPVPAVPPNPAADGRALSTLPVAPAGTVQGVDVTVSVNHPAVQELSMYLVAPNGTRVTLVNAGAAAPNNATGNSFTNTHFVDGAPTLSTGAAPYSGNFAPATPLAGLVGAATNGIWLLEVVDRNGNSVSGSIVSWSLNLTTNTPYPSADVPQGIPENNTTGIESSLGLFGFLPGTTIPNVPGAVEVTLNITHAAVQELDVALRAPNGETVPLVVFGAGAPNAVTGANFTNTIFSSGTTGATFLNLSQGTAPYNSAVTPGTVTKFRPASGPNALDIFNGDDPSGLWTLIVKDRVGAATPVVGTLTGWSLNLLTTSQYSQAPSAAVPSDGNGVATTTVVDFPAGTQLDQLDVTVSVDHAGASPVSLFLVGPDNTRVFLGSGSSFQNTTFTDLVQDTLADGTAPFTGSFLPEESLADSLGGKVDGGVNGIWRLEVANNSGVAATVTQFQIALREAVIQSILPGPIPDGDVTTSTIAVTGVPAGETISEVSVITSITHPRISDLQLALIAPDGTRVVLSNGNYSTGGAMTGANYTDTVFMDDATLPINFPPPGGLTTLAPYTGRWRPVDPLFSLVGKDPNGLWRLEVRDTVTGEVGTLDRFRLRIRTVPEFVANPGTAIPNPGVISSTRGVSGFSATDRIADLNVNVQITHPAVGQLRAALIGPDGTRVELIDDTPPPGFPPLTGANLNTAFDDQAPAPIGTGAAPYVGRFRPVQPLSAFNGRVPNGTWTLEVRDTAGGNPLGAASLGSWSLEIQTVERANQMPQPVNDLSFTTAEIVVSGVPAAQFVTSVTANVSISHPVAEDLELYLIGPNGLSVALAVQRGGTTADAYIDTTFDDTAAQSIATASAPFVGSYRPEQPLAGFYGVNPNGVWQLLVFDRATGQFLPTEGLLNRFSIDIRTASVTTTITDPNAMDQDADSNTAEVPAAGSFSVDAYAAPRSFAGNPFATPLDDAFNGTPFQAPYNTQTLPLMISGPHIADRISYAAKGGQVNVPIPDRGVPNGPNGVATSTLVIGGDLGRQITNATVTVNIGHARVGDLTLTLIAPDGTRILLSKNQGGTGANYFNTTFDDGALNPNSTARSIVGAAAPFAGNFRPQQSDGSDVTPLNPALGRLVGKFAAGTWTLEAVDSVSNFTGTINGWSLNLQTTLVATDRAVDGFHIVFDRDMDPATFTVADILRVEGPLGALAPTDPQGNELPVTVTADPFFDPNNPDPDPAFPRTYRIGFNAPQRIGGSYAVTLGPNIRSKTGELMDANRNAGLDALRGVVSDAHTGSIITVKIDARNASGGTQLSQTIPANGTLTSTLAITDNFLIQDLDVQLNIAHNNVPNLEARLVGIDPSGDPNNNITVLLFRGVGNTGSRANFNNTVFDDAAGTPIQNGNPPFQFSYNPQVGLPIAGLPGLSGVPLSAFNNQTAARTWRLEIINTGNLAGTLNSWSLTMKKPLPGTGLGEPVSDQTTVSFRVFNMDPTKPLSANTWNQVSAGVGARGPNLNPEVAGRVNAITADPSDPSGNTYYIATPAGGVWKTTNFLTTDPTGPTWVALTPDGPTNGLHIGSIVVVGRNNDPNQSIILAGTGDAEVLGDPQRPDDLTSRGVGFLRSMDGGKTWELLDSRDNGIPFSGRDHFFAAGNGTVAYRIVADPRLTPTGEAIFYAALSDLDSDKGDTYNQLVTASGEPIRGGLWRSVDSGRTWTQMRAGQATDVVLDLASGTGAPGGNIQRLYAAFRNDGVFQSVNRGQSWDAMPGVTGNPLVQNGDGLGQPQPVPVVGPPVTQAFQTGNQAGNSGAASTRTTPNSYTTNGANIPTTPPAAEPSLGRILLAKPAPTGDALKDALYQGWLYSAVMVHHELNVPGLPPGDQVQYPNRIIDPPSNLWGIFVTKDYGANWTRILNPLDPYLGTQPTNWYDPTPPVPSLTPQIDPTGVGTPTGNYYFKANFSSALAVDPNDPNVIYFGSTDMFGSAGMIRINTTGISDAQALYLSNDDPLIDPTLGSFRTWAGYNGPSVPTSAALNQLNATGAPITLTYNAARLPVYPQRDPNLVVPGVYDPKIVSESFINLLRDPAQPFLVNATILVAGVAHINNVGTKSKWIPYTIATQPDPFLPASTDTWSRPTRGLHQILPTRDPLTGATRLLMANDNGIYTVVDEGDGTLLGSVGGVTDVTTKTGNVDVVNGSRNGNLSIAQFLAGASQPSTVSAEVSALRGMFYGNGTDTGQPVSDANIIDVGQQGYGNISWHGTRLRDPNPALGGQADLTREAGNGVGVSQSIDPATGRVLDYVYYFANPEGLVERDFTGDRFHAATDFFQANNISVTNGLVQTPGGGDVPDSQWPFRHGFPFAVNPRDGGQVLISSNVGRVFLRDVGAFGDQWVVVGNPPSAGFDGTPARALAFGAPKVTSPGDPPPTFADHLYAGTQAGSVYVTFTGGGTPGVGNQWRNITANLPVNAGTGLRSPIVGIFPNPDVGSRELYLATTTNVYYLADSNAAAPNWVDITGNLFSITIDPFGDASLRQARLRQLTALQVDWRYVIPDNFGAPTGSTHPILYVSGDGGVYRTIDKGGNWHLFPDVALNNSTLGDGGGLPNARVTDIDLSLGPINQTTGRPDTSRGPNILLASTYGMGQYAVRLAPLTIPNLPNQPRILGIDTASDSGLSNTDHVTNDRTPNVIGLGEQTAFGNVVYVTLYDLTDDPANPRYIGGFPVDGNPTDPANLANTSFQTNTAGRFGVTVLDGMLTTDGVKTIGVQATSLAGTKGNMATFQFTLDTTAPAAPTAVQLLGISDTGLNNNGAALDQITRTNANLQFRATFVADPNGLNTQVQLHRNNLPVGATAQGLTNVTLIDPGVVSPDGTYGYRVRLTDQAGNQTDLSISPLLHVRIDTTAPAQPSKPLLDPGDPNANPARPSSDSGAAGDRITNVRQPYFSGTAESNTQANPNDPSITQANRVELLDSAGNVVGRADVLGGKYLVQPSTPLADGSYTFVIRVTDVAGNQSQNSVADTFTIVSVTPNKPTLDLVNADDSGDSTDNITNVRQPRLEGVGDRDLFVQIISYPTLADALAKTNGSVAAPLPGADPIIVQSDRKYQLQYPTALDDGTYFLVARTFDVAANFNDSDVLTLTILTEGPTEKPTLALVVADDTGTKGDGVTSILRPRFKASTATPFATVQLVRGDGVVLETKQANSAGVVDLQPPLDLVNGTIELFARLVDTAGNTGVPSDSILLRIVPTSGDYNADGLADFAVYRPSTGGFLSLLSNTTATVPAPTGGSFVDVPVSLDLDGDGYNDLGYFNPSTATWTIRLNQHETRIEQLGTGTNSGGQPVAVPGDYDGDGVFDLAVYDRGTNVWTISQSRDGLATRLFGAAGDIPVPADYDGDFRVDIATFNPSSGAWGGQLSAGGSFSQVLGQAGDHPVPGDYNGDLRADIAIYRPSTGAFLVKLGSGTQTTTLGTPGDIPVPLDYDNDGKHDLAVFRPSAGQWIVSQSSQAGAIRTVNLGANGDKPLPAPYELRSAARPTIGLLAADDTGVAGDGITTVVRPRMTGTGIPGLTVVLVDVAGNITGVPGTVINTSPATVASNGTYQIQFTNNLAVGNYTVAARMSDTAGNALQSTNFALQIIKGGGTGGGGGTLPVPAIVMFAGDDSGSKGDGRTSLRRPRFTITSAAGIPVTVQLLDDAGSVLASQQLAAAGNVTLQPSANQANGLAGFRARIVDTANANNSSQSDLLTIRFVTTEGDYDADAVADFATYRRSNGSFASLLSGGGTAPAPTGGTSRDVPIQGDFDGDGRTDLGYFRPSSATWVIERSTAGALTRQFGPGGTHVPIVGDFDADGIDDIGVYVRKTSTFSISMSSNGNKKIQFTAGNPNNIPVVGDFDGDGRADYGVFRPSDARWAIAPSSGGSNIVRQFGNGSSDVPAVADYDGDNITDLALYRASAGRYIVKQSTNGATVNINVGGPSTNQPVPQDFDNDGKADAAIFKPNLAQWVVRQSSDGQNRTVNLGAINDVAVGTPYHPWRIPPSSGGGNSRGIRAKGHGKGKGVAMSSFGVIVPPNGDLANQFLNGKKRKKK